MDAKLDETVTHPGQPMSTTRQDLIGCSSSPQGIQVVNSPTGIGVIADYSLQWSGGLAVLALADLGLAFLSVAVEDDGGSPYQVIFEGLVQVLGVKTGEV